jgi:hypothetical protein
MQKYLLPWNERSIITANLLNPAFCGEVIRHCVYAYNEKRKTTEGKKAFPFYLLFLILPIVLHKKTRESLEKRKDLYSWINDNPEIKLKIKENRENLLPYSKEAISFLLMYNAIEVNNESVSVTSKPITDEELKEYYTIAQKLGNLFFEENDFLLIHTYLNIKL